MLAMAGVFRRHIIDPDETVEPSSRGHEPAQTAYAEVRRIMEYYEAVGTVRPLTETNIEAQITARILDISVRPGEKVSIGQILIVLDGRELQARLDQSQQGLLSSKARREQARQAVKAARARRDQAQSAYKRVKIYFESEAATSQDFERAEANFLQARAGLKQAEDGLREARAGVKQAEKVVEQARIGLDYAQIKAPEEGEVVRRLAEPGDLAWPGKSILTLQTRGSLRLEAVVREGLIQRIKTGARLEVMISAIEKKLHGRVDEVVPSADPMTRTFLVKVNLPQDPDLYPGMFGRLLVPLDEEAVVTVPKTAVTRIGQLEMVSVKENGRWRQIYVRTGRDIDGNWCEVLSGLQGGELVALGRVNHG
jgi:RND family efflux transporter MFP subunit